MSDCNPACVKIILNGGLMAPAAEQLVEQIERRYTNAYSPIVKPALELARTARALVEMYTHAEKFGAIERVGEFQFEGCEHAKKLMQWTRALMDGGDDLASVHDELSNAPALIRGWRRELIDSMSAIAAGN